MIPAWLRPSSRGARELQAALIALLASLAIGSVLMMLVGASPATVWARMLTETFGSSYHVGQLLYRATALVLTGLAVAVALDAGLFNIGGEGQLTAGVLGCSVVGAALPASTPAIVAIPLCIVVAAGCGAVVGFAIGAMRVYRNAHEVITSIMLNAIVAGVALWIGNEFLFEGGTTRGPVIVAGARLPQLGFDNSAVNASIVVSIVAVAGCWWLRSRTTWGADWRTIGADAAAARTVGIPVGRMQLAAMTLSGALAGLAAVNFVLGHKHAFEEGLGRGVGFLGISAALLGRVHPAGVLIASLLLALLAEGGVAVGRDIPKELTEMLQGVVVLAVAGASAWVRRRGA